VGYQSKEQTPQLIEWLEGSREVPTDGEFNPLNDVGRLFSEGDDFPQGNLFLRGPDHAGFVRQYIVRVKEFDGVLAHEVIAVVDPGVYPPTGEGSAGCRGLI